MMSICNSEPNSYGGLGDLRQSYFVFLASGGVLVLHFYGWKPELSSLGSTLSKCEYPQMVVVVALPHCEIAGLTELFFVFIFLFVLAHRLVSSLFRSHGVPMEPTHLTFSAVRHTEH
ncbi:hypothetical protein BDV37DRAFT_161803 [Aspergillus pseudonomiae]|uniref:Uncharacterized protein n=1 Tax=Aspergillus pseudonomiae TaxID=1506151 RepID=A0A5N7D735_9EURO|nr:uncharacterized protein BDV37DRAFT_161803 [Aspergillus pseudonomiae]KAE8402216.1 hypothetical protein BDV37DRAFT_161803 [Aspergillus pseudonomiae]